MQERAGSAALEADGVVVVGPVPAQVDTPRRSSSAVSTPGSPTRPSAAPSRRARSGRAPSQSWLASASPRVDDVDTRLGRVALAGVCSSDAAAMRGKRYGIKPTAEDGPLPPLEPVVPEPGG